MTPDDYAALLSATAGRALGDIGDKLGAVMADTLPGARITPPLRLAHFLGQTCEETGGFKWFAELGGPDYFAKYDGRADLGNTQPGDGYRFRGRSPLMLTGRANYVKYGEQLGLDLVNDPDLALEPEAGMRIAAAYWTDHGLNDLADQDNAVAITRRINGGLNGLSERVAALKRAKFAIAAMPSPQETPTAAPVVPAITVAPAPAEPATAQPASPSDPTAALPSIAQTVVASNIRHLLAGLGITTGILGSLSPDQLDQVVAILTGLVIFGAVGVWAWLKDRAAHAIARKAYLTPAPGQALPALSDADVQRIAAAVAASHPA